MYRPLELPMTMIFPDSDSPKVLVLLGDGSAISVSSTMSASNLKYTPRSWASRRATDISWPEFPPPETTILSGPEERRIV